VNDVTEYRRPAIPEGGNVPFAGAGRGRRHVSRRALEAFELGIERVAVLGGVEAVDPLLGGRECDPVGRAER
jgi:hypothetical protein